MASNRVNVGAFVNPLDQLTKATSDIGAQYGRQLEADKERLRLNAAAEESKRRFEQNRADTAARNAILDERYATEYKAEQDRLAEQDRIAAAERERIAKERQALQTYLTNYTPEAAAEAALARDPALRKSLDEQFGANRETLAENAIINATKTQQGGIGSEFGESMGLTQDLIPEDAYAAIVKARETNPESPMVKAFDAQLAALEQQQKDYLLSMPVYQEQENARIRREMGAAGVNPAVIASVAKDLSGAYQSSKDVNSQALAWQKAQDARAKATADLAYKALNLSNKGATANGSTYIKPKSISDLEARKTIEQKFDANSLFGLDSDNTDFFNWFKAAQEAGVDDAVALRALEDKVDDSIFGRSEKGNVEDFIKYAQAMEAANTANKTGRSYQDYLKMITPATTAYVDPKVANREAFIGGALGLRPERQGLPLVPFSGTEQPTTSEETPVPLAVLTPKEEAQVRVDAIARGVNPDQALEFAKDQRQSVLDYQANPDQLALTQPTTWSSIGTRKGSDKNPRDNFIEFAEMIKGADLGNPDEVEAIGKLYGGNKPLSNQVVLKIADDIMNGRVINAEVAPMDVPTNILNEPGIEPVYPEAYILPALRAVKPVVQGAKALPGLGRTLLTPKAPVTNPSVTGVMGPSKDLYWNSLSTPTTTRLGDAARLNAWLRANANPR